MKVKKYAHSFFSPDEPLYLPEFYRYFFDNLPSGHEIRVIIVPPIYKNTTKMALSLKYAKTFGVKEAAALSLKVVYYKMMDFFIGEKGGVDFIPCRQFLKI